MRKLVLFDIDGTLVLTGGAGMRAMARAFDRVIGLRGALAGISLAGRTDRAIMDEVLARAGAGAMGADTVAAFLERYAVFLHEEMQHDVPDKRVLPGVAPLLDRLAAQGDVEVALLTGNFPETARIKLDHFGLWRHFAWGAFGGEERDRNRLLPIALAQARDRGLTPDPQHVLVVGDTPHDVACARSGGAHAVAVATGVYARAALAACEPDTLLDDLSDTDGFMRLVAQ